MAKESEKNNRTEYSENPYITLLGGLVAKIRERFTHEETVNMIRPLHKELMDIKHIKGFIEYRKPLKSVKIDENSRLGEDQPMPIK